MINIDEINDAVHLLLTHPDCIAWSDFGDKGNVCCGPYQLKTQKEIIEDALALACVKIIIAKGTPIHYQLSSSVAKILRAKYVTYDWLIKVVGRIVSVGSYADFFNILRLSVAVKEGMKKRGLTKIQFIEEAFA